MYAHRQNCGEKIQQWSKLSVFASVVNASSFVASSILAAAAASNLAGLDAGDRGCAGVNAGGRRRARARRCAGAGGRGCAGAEGARGQRVRRRRGRARKKVRGGRWDSNHGFADADGH